MMYYETLADNDDQFKVQRLGKMVWLDLGRGVDADSEFWIEALYSDLDYGLLDTEHVKELREMLIEAGHDDSTRNLMKILSILATANEKGWFE